MPYNFEQIGAGEQTQGVYDFENIGASWGESGMPTMPQPEPEIPTEKGRGIGGALSYIPFVTLSALKGIVKPLFAPLEDTRFDTNKAIAEAVEWWREKTSAGVEIPDVGIGKDLEDKWEIQRRQPTTPREIIGATAELGGFVAGPVRVAGKAAGALTVKLEPYARPLYQSIFKGMATGALLGEGKKEQTLEYMALFGVFEPLAYGLGRASKVPEAIRNSTAWRQMTIKERGLVLQSLDESIAASAQYAKLLESRGTTPKAIQEFIKSSEGQILKKWNNPTWRKEALSKRVTIEPKPQVEPVVTPKPISPTPIRKEPVTVLAKKFKETIKAEKVPGPLELLKKQEAQIKAGKIDFETVGKLPKPAPTIPEAIKPTSDTPAAQITDRTMINDETMGQIKQRVLEGNKGVKKELEGVLKEHGKEAFEDWMNPMKMRARLKADLDAQGMPKEERKAKLKSIMAEYERIYNEIEEVPRTKEVIQKEDTATLFSGFPIHKFGKAAKELEAIYDKHVGTPLWDYVSETLPEKAGKKSKIIDAANKGLIYDYRKDPKFVELWHDTHLKIAQHKEKTKKVAQAIAKFPPAEQIRVSQIIKGSITVTPQKYAKAFEVIKEFQRLEKELQTLGILGSDNYLRKFTQKELVVKFKEAKEIDTKILKLKAQLKPIITVGKTVKTVSQDISEKIISTSVDTSKGKFETKITKWSKLNEQRITEALLTRGFAAGEAEQMISRVKESVVPLEGKTGTIKEITNKIERTVTKTVAIEIRKTKSYSRMFMARARGSIIKDINKLAKEHKAIIDRIQKHYKTSGKLYLRRAYDKIENEKSTLEKIINYIKKPRLKKGYAIQRKDLSHEYRQHLGEIKRAPYLVYKGLSEETHDAELMKLFVQVSKNKNWAILPEELLNIKAIKSRQHLVEKYESFKPLPVTDKLGPLSGALVDSYIWDDLNQAVAIRSDAIKAWDKILTLWKTGKVVYNPATHCRNILSNIILADFAGLAPHRIDIYARAARDFLHKGDYWKEAKQSGLLGTEWAATEIEQFLKDTSRLTEGNFLTKSSEVVRSLLDKPGKAYQGIEQFFKLSVFINGRKQGLSIKEAARIAEKGIFNYQKIPPAIRWAKRWYSPFITFSYKALPRFAETVVRKPWKIAKYATLMLMVEEITRRMYGESKEEMEREKKILPDYMRKTVLPGQLSHLRIPYKDKYGRSKYLDMSFILPWGDVAEQWGQSHLVGRPFLPNHPLYVSVGEVAFNEILFTGQELTSEGLDEGWDYWGKIAKQIWRQAAPSLAGSYSYNKLMTAYTGERDWALRDRSLSEAVFDVFFGLKVRSIDYNEEHARRIKTLRGHIDTIKERFQKDYKKIVFQEAPVDPFRKSQSDKGKRIEKLFITTGKEIDRIIDKITELEK